MKIFLLVSTALSAAPGFELKMPIISGFSGSDCKETIKSNIAKPIGIELFTCDSEAELFDKNIYLKVLALQITGITKNFDYNDENPYIKLSILMHTFFQDILFENDTVNNLSWISLLSSKLYPFKKAYYGKDYAFNDDKLAVLIKKSRELGNSSLIKKMKSFFDANRHLNIWLNFASDPTDEINQKAFLVTFGIESINEGQLAVEYKSEIFSEFIGIIGTYLNYERIFLTEICFDNDKLAHLEALINFNGVKIIKFSRCSSIATNSIDVTKDSSLSGIRCSMNDESLEGVIANILEKILSVDFFSFSDIKGNKLLDLCCRRTNLRIFELDSISFTDENIKTVQKLIKNNKNLKLIKFVQISDGFNNLSKLEELKTLFKNITDCKELDKLVVNGCDFRVQGLLAYFDQLIASTKLRNLVFMNTPFLFENYASFASLGHFIARLKLKSVCFENLFDFEISGKFFNSVLKNDESVFYKVSPMEDFMNCALELIYNVVYRSASTLRILNISRNKLMFLTSFNLRKRIEPLLGALALAGNLKELNISETLLTIDTENSQPKFQDQYAMIVVKLLNSLMGCSILNISNNNLYGLLNGYFLDPKLKIMLPGSIIALNAGNNELEFLDSAYLQHMFVQLKLDRLDVISKKFNVGENEVFNYSLMIRSSQLRTLIINHMNFELNETMMPLFWRNRMSILSNNNLMPFEIARLILNTGNLVNITYNFDI